MSSTTKVMRKTLIIIMAALALAFDAPHVKSQPSMKIYEELGGVQSMQVVRLRDPYCGGVPAGSPTAGVPPIFSLWASVRAIRTSKCPVTCSFTV